MVSKNQSTDFIFTKNHKSRNTIVDLLKIVAADARSGFLICDMDMTYASALLERLEEQGIKTTVTAVLLKAISHAQQRKTLSRTDYFPFRSLVTYNRIVAGFTVERMVDGLPTVFLGEIEEPHLKSIKQITDELKRHASAPIEEIPAMRLQKKFSRLPVLLRRLILSIGKFFPALRYKCIKATFGLTSLGKLGVSALLCPCLCSSTFGIGEIEERPVVMDDQIVIRKQMTISLNFDLRVFDYTEGAGILNNIVSLMEGQLEQFLNEEERMSAKADVLRL